MKRIKIVKASGETDIFSEEKYTQSLRNSGASDSLIGQVLEYIAPYLHDGITTKEIYHLTHQFLRRKKKSQTAGRYNLKQAILQLGPSGFPFERLIGEIFKRKGYAVDIEKEIQGKCAVHEVDVIAKKKHEFIIAECKFHNRQGIKCALKTILYVKARYDDIKEFFEQKNLEDSKQINGYLITNTKMTSVVINYGICRNVGMLAWDYPYNKGLEKIIDEMNLHPVTCLSSISRKIKHLILNRGIIFCRDLMNKEEILKQLKLDGRKIEKVIQECQDICEKI